jgi:hypothetical protein
VVEIERKMNSLKMKAIRIGKCRNEENTKRMEVEKEKN